MVATVVTTTLCFNGETMQPDVSLQKVQAAPDITIDKPNTQEERLRELEAKMSSIAQMLYMFKRSGLPKKVVCTKRNTTAEGLPYNTCFLGYTKGSTYPYILVVSEEGKYMIGDREFDTLDAATEIICGEAVNGFNFWQTFEGMSLEEFIK